MQIFTNEVNRRWAELDPVVLAAFVLWRLNHIHPFVNGNGRTARVSAYFVLCISAGGWLPGDKLLPERLVENRPEYVAALQAVDASLATGKLDLTLHGLIARLLDEQLSSAGPMPAGPASAPPSFALPGTIADPDDPAPLV